MWGGGNARLCFHVCVCVHVCVGVHAYLCICAMEASGLLQIFPSVILHLVF